MKKCIIWSVLVFLFMTSQSYAQTGKISGRIIDAETGEPLPGVNVMLVDTDMGAATGQEGYYNIINVPPGQYHIRASFIGYSTVTVRGIRVNIDLTTTQDFELQSQAIAGEEVVVEATAPVVKPDISANIANVSAEEIESVPVAGVSDYINLQAGVEPGMTIRGGGLDEVAFVVDGLNTRSGRDDTPFTGISYTAVDEFQIQTGGFNAEYGNVRSGLINIVTKEGPRDRYTADVMLRYTPPQKKYFGIMPDNPNSYWMRPHLDDDVAWTGTHGADSPWDKYMRDSYPQFDGWNSRAAVVLNDDDPTNDMTPEQAQQLFLWRTRKDFSPGVPDYQADGSFGGPVPFLSSALGDMRFFGSYRQTQKAYIVPQMRESYWDQTGQLKLTSNISSNMKLMVQGSLVRQAGINPSSTGSTSILDGTMPQYPWHNSGMVNRINYSDINYPIFAFNLWNPMDIYRNTVGAKLTHNLTANTFYEINLQRKFVDYFTRPARERDYSCVQQFGSYCADEAPRGWSSGVTDKPGAEVTNFDPTHSIRLSGHWGSARDSSNVSTWDASFDITSQINRWSQMKAGIELIFRDYHTKHGEWDPYMVHHPNPKYLWDRSLTQGAVYLQDKLEFQGMVANVGVRMDYFMPNEKFYDYETYDRAFSPLIGFNELDEYVEMKSVDPQFNFAPRLGISYPITANSKLFFNYGHFRQMLHAQELMGIRAVHGSQIDQIGNPTHPMPRTVSYELGYEHNILNQLLLRLNGYYKSIDKQPRGVWYTSVMGQIDYQVHRPYNYEDIRGFELTLNKNIGRWIRGFVNYTYMVRKSGNFGYDHHYQNDFEQLRYEREYWGYQQWTPIPEPFGRFNVTFLLPPDFGPRFAGINPLGDWRLNLLGEYRSGDVFTWSGGSGSIPGLSNNVKWADFYMLDIRLAKNFDFGLGRAQLYIDVNNVLNLKYMYRHSAFAGQFDWENYMWSLHLPEDTFSDLEDDPYPFIYGDDRPGDYRKPGVEFQPVEIASELPDGGPDYLKRRAWYYNTKEEQYYAWHGSWDAEAGEWTTGSWDTVDPVAVDQMVEDKAYINMPNNTSFRFLNPRMVFFGIRFWF